MKTRAYTILGLLIPSLVLFVSGCSLTEQTEKTVIPAFIYVTVIGTNNKSLTIQAKVDTGATRSSIDTRLVALLELQEVEGAQVYIKGASGSEIRDRFTARIMFCGKIRDTFITAADRDHLQFDMILGREDLEGYLIDPAEPVNPDGGEFWFDTIELEENPQLNRSLSC